MLSWSKLSTAAARPHVLTIILAVVPLHDAGIIRVAQLNLDFNTCILHRKHPHYNRKCSELCVMGKIDCEKEYILTRLHGC